MQMAKQKAQEVDISTSQEDDVSDAEALLACWSYLQKRKRLGNWTQSEQRKMQSKLSRTQFLMEDEDISDGGALYTHHDYETEFVSDNEQDYSDVEDEDEDSDDSEFSGDIQNSITSLIDDAIFLDINNKPSKSFLRRSKAIKKRWKDPSYRQKWYASRWGGDSKKKKGSKTINDRERKAEALARALPKNFLGSPELAAMTEQEISEAIATRMESTRKRVSSRQQTLQQRKQYLQESNQAVIQKAKVQGSNPKSSHDTPTLHRDSLFVKTPQQLLAEKERRSQAAKKRYQKRLENEKLKNEKRRAAVKPSSTPPPTKPAKPDRKYWPPKQLTPRDALLRIEDSIENGKLPAASDIKLVLQPKRLAQRKELLQRVLNESFNQYGKCVPVVSSRDPRSTGLAADDIGSVGHGRDDETRHEFVTHSNVESLGSYILELLEEQRGGQDVR